MYIYGKNVVKEMVDASCNIKEAFVYKDSRDYDLIRKLEDEELLKYK